MATVKASGIKIGLQTGTARTLYASWTLSGSKAKHTDHCDYEWEYYLNKRWFMGSSGSESKAPNGSTWTTTWSVPENADTVRFRVKPISKTYKKNKKEVKYYTSSFSSFKKHKVVVSKLQKKLKVEATIDWDNTGSTTYPIIARITPVCKGYDSKENNWFSGWSAEWTFWNGDYWSGGYSQDYNPGTRNLEYVGSIPSDAIKVKLFITANADNNPQIVSEQQVVRKDIALVSRTVIFDSFQRLAHTNRQVVAKWKMGNSNLLENFEVEWSYLLDKHWVGASTSTVKADTVGSGGIWTSEPYTIPENVINVRCRIKPISNENSPFVDAWSSYYAYYYNVNSRSLDDSKITLTRQNAKVNRTLEVRWAHLAGEENNTSQYECLWQYSYGTKDKDKFYNGGTTTVSATDPNLVSTYTPPDDKVAQVRVQVRPVPKYENVYVGAWSSIITYIYPSLPQIKITGLNVARTAQANERAVQATWDYKGSYRVTGYECRWEYYFKHPVLSDMWVIDNTSTVESRMTSYTIPAGATTVRLAVKPIPENELEAVGVYSTYVQYVWVVSSRQVRNLKVEKERGSDRTLKVTWDIADPTNVADYTMDYRYLRSGVWVDSSASDETTVGKSIFFEPGDVPGGGLPEQVQVRVKPNDESGSDINFVGDWSPYVTYRFSLDARSVTNLEVHQQRGSDRTAVATWAPEDTTELAGYEYQWRYYIDGIWFDGSEGNATVETPACTYDAPALASLVEIRVRPTPEFSTSFSPDWSHYEIFEVPGESIPGVPDTPSTSFDKTVLTAQVDNYDEKAASIEFELSAKAKDGNFEIWESSVAPITLNRAAAAFTLLPGFTYRVRARALNDEDEESEWSSWSGDIYTIPEAIEEITEIYATAEMSVVLGWEEAEGATSYTIERTTKLRYFDVAPDLVDQSTDYKTPHAEITGIDTGVEWFFRVKAVNEQGESDWSEISSITLGVTPSAPTTWSSRSVGMIDEDIYLYWIHNSEDNSYEKEAELELIVNGESDIISIEKTDENKSETSYYLISANTYSSGAKIQWRVRTKGIMPDFGEWSTQRMIDLYTPPSVSVSLSNTVSWEWDPFTFDKETIYDASGDIYELADGTLTTFPLLVSINSEPTTQTPVVYVISLISNESYDSVNENGNPKVVTVGDELFRRYYYTDKHEFVGVIDVSDVDLVNGMSYTVEVSVSMDSGLNATASKRFVVDMEDADAELDAEVTYDEEKYAAYITPYCDREDGSPVDNIMLSVYRLNFDGSFTELAKNLSNEVRPTVTDPHPSLDYARYRIVGRFIDTGKTIFYDLPPLPINETSIILQWNETWVEYGKILEEEPLENLTAGTTLVLPYNVDESDSNEIDVELVDYIGRSHPVSYYGTQVGQTTQWSSDVPKDDLDTLFSLRRLAIWTGNVYVRSPSGTGYWAHVKVSYNRDHNTVIMPVSLSITRVDGGI